MLYGAEFTCESSCLPACGEDEHIYLYAVSMLDQDDPGFGRESVNVLRSAN